METLQLVKVVVNSLKHSNLKKRFPCNFVKGLFSSRRFFLEPLKVLVLSRLTNCIRDMASAADAEEVLRLEVNQKLGKLTK